MVVLVLKPEHTSELTAWLVIQTAGSDSVGLKFASLTSSQVALLDPGQDFEDHHLYTHSTSLSSTDKPARPFTEPNMVAHDPRAPVTKTSSLDRPTS